MRVLILHNTYQHRGGEDTVVDNEASLLTTYGHTVRVEALSNHAISTPADRIKTFISAPYNSRMAEWAEALVRETGADVAHVHNFFPLMTPAVHHGARRAGAAVVQTLHNYRLLCASAMFLRNGAVCEKCLTGGKIWGAIHRCYRQSLPGSIAVTAMQIRAEMRGSWRNDVDAFIALTQFARGKFIEGGLPAEKIFVKPNFTSGKPPEASILRTGGLYVGRLSPEKGVKTLLEAWKAFPDLPLRIVGDGPQRGELEQQATSNVSFLGSLPPCAVRSHMEKAALMIVPSQWYEGFPMTIVEAYSAGLPVIASDIGSLSEVVKDGITGRIFKPGDANDLIDKISWMINRPTPRNLSESTAAAFFDNYTGDKNIELLETIYGAAIARRNAN